MVTSPVRRVAFVTGASRGVGKNSAIWLARAGFDVAITARTIEPGEEREHSTSIHRSDTSPLQGSLTETSAAVEAEGGRCLSLPADVLDEPSLRVAVATVLEEWGRVDVVVHSARYVGAGHMDPVLDTTPDALINTFRANVVAPMIIDQLVIPQMAERGSGVIVHVTSAAAFSDPVLRIGSGGWGASYGITKSGIHRLTGYLAVEHADDGILVYNLQPGTVSTERVPHGQENSTASDAVARREPADVVGASIAWLATSPEAARLNGRTIEAPFLCRELGLLPDWDGPSLNVQGRHDISAATLSAMEAALRDGRTPPSHFEGQ